MGKSDIWSPLILGLNGGRRTRGKLAGGARSSQAMPVAEIAERAVLFTFQTAEFLLDDSEQGFEAFVHGVPNGLVEY